MNALRVSRRQLRGFAAIGSITISCYCARTAVPDPGERGMRQAEPPPTGCTREIKREPGQILTL